MLLSLPSLPLVPLSFWWGLWQVMYDCILQPYNTSSVVILGDGEVCWKRWCGWKWGQSALNCGCRHPRSWRQRHVLLSKWSISVPLALLLTYPSLFFSALTVRVFYAVAWTSVAFYPNIIGEGGFLDAAFAVSSARIIGSKQGFVWSCFILEFLVKN